MPFVQIDVTRDGVTKEQKQELILGVTKLLKEVLDKDFHLTHVIIREVETDNWGLGGEQVTEIRKQTNE
ncbi:MAG: 4-oxalocrotonate tautomerase family protein [Ferruginibacter sp.]|nr:4-oxalocrotonate tautomerase family protein [Bacteroidota bacterium]MBX2919719.1 4-oxalocrotonate tautomerase family protein [Ferruginibacter sp.]